MWHNFLRKGFYEETLCIRIMHIKSTLKHSFSNGICMNIDSKNHMKNTPYNHCPMVYKHAMLNRNNICDGRVYENLVSLVYPNLTAQYILSKPFQQENP